MHFLVTGGDGFLGRHLVRALVNRGDTVAVFSRKEIPDRANVTHIRGDVVEAESLARAFQGRSYDAIFHLAGAYARAEPEILYKVHVIGTVALLNAVKTYGTSETRIIVMSSGAVYGACPEKIIREDSPLLPLGHYGVSKVCAEATCTAGYRESGMNVAIARAFNVVGPGGNASLLHAAVASQLAAIKQDGLNGNLRLGDLSSYRDFVDVRDAVAGLLLLARHALAGEAYNLCSGNAVQTRVLVQKMIQLSGINADIDEFVAPIPPGVPFQQGSYEKISKCANWTPQISLEQSLLDTILYWQENYANNALAK